MRVFICTLIIFIGSHISQAKAQVHQDSVQSIILKEVEIKAIRNLVKMEPGKLTYNVEHDADAQEKSVLDIMHKIPMLNVNSKGQITTVNDKQIIYKLNGMRDPLLRGDITTVLQAIGAKYVKRIELDYQPGIQYGMNTIVINIVTKNRLEGFLGAIMSRASDSNWNNVGYALSKSKRLTFSINYQNIWDYFHSDQTKTDEYRYQSTDFFRTFKYTKSDGFRSNGHSTEFSASYDVDDNSLLNIYGRIILKNQSNPHENKHESSVVYRKDGSLNYAYSKYTHRLYKNNEYEAHASFEHNFLRGKETAGKMYIGYEFYEHPIQETITSTYTEIDSLTASKGSMNQLFNYIWQENDKEPFHTLEAEFWHNLKGGHRITFNTKYVNRPQSVDNTLAKSYPNTLQYDLETDPSDNYKHAQQVLTLNTSYEYNSRKMRGLLGISYEYQHDKLRHSKAGHDFQKDFRNFLPKAEFAWTTSPKTSWTLSYGMSVSRPSMSVLDPFINTTTPMQVSYGNTHLKPERTNEFSLSLNRNIRQYTFLATLTQSFTNKMMLQHRFLEGDILHITTDNLGSRSYSSLFTSFSGRPIEQIFARITQLLSYSSYKAASIEEKSHGWFWRISGMLEWEFPHDLYLDINGNYHTRYILFQGKGTYAYDYSLFLSKYFFANKLRISINADNFLPTHFINTTDKSTADYTYHFSYRMYQANFSISVRYTFGKLKARVKNSDKQIQRDNDIKYEYDN